MKPAAHEMYESEETVRGHGVYPQQTKNKYLRDQAHFTNTWVHQSGFEKRGPSRTDSRQDSSPDPGLDQTNQMPHLGPVPTYQTRDQLPAWTYSTDPGLDRLKQLYIH